MGEGGIRGIGGGGGIFVLGMTSFVLMVFCLLSTQPMHVFSPLSLF